MSYTKAQVETAIAAIADNPTKSNTASMIRDVLTALKEMVQDAGLIKLTSGETIEDVVSELVVQNIPEWSAKEYEAGYCVYHDGLIYRATDIVFDTDLAPDVSAKWNSLDGLKPTPIFSTNLTTNQIDWSLDAEIFFKTITANTTLTFANTSNALNKIITLVFTGNYTLTFPATCRLTTTAYNATTYPNYIRIHCVYVHPTDHTQDIFYVTITKQSAI